MSGHRYAAIIATAFVAGFSGGLALDGTGLLAAAQWGLAAVNVALCLLNIRLASERS